MMVSGIIWMIYSVLEDVMRVFLGMHLPVTFATLMRARYESLQNLNGDKLLTLH